MTSAAHAYLYCQEEKTDFFFVLKLANLAFYARYYYVYVLRWFSSATPDLVRL